VWCALLLKCIKRLYVYYFLQCSFREKLTDAASIAHCLPAAFRNRRARYANSGHMNSVTNCRSALVLPKTGCANFVQKPARIAGKKHYRVPNRLAATVCVDFYWDRLRNRGRKSKKVGTKTPSEIFHLFFRRTCRCFCNACLIKMSSNRSIHSLAKSDQRGQGSSTRLCFAARQQAVHQILPHARYWHSAEHVALSRDDSTRKFIAVGRSAEAQPAAMPAIALSEVSRSNNWGKSDSTAVELKRSWLPVHSEAFMVDCRQKSKLNFGKVLSFDTAKRWKKDTAGFPNRMCVRVNASNCVDCTNNQNLAKRLESGLSKFDSFSR